MSSSRATPSSRSVAESLRGNRKAAGGGGFFDLADLDADSHVSSTPSLQANYNKIRNHNKGKSTFSMAVNEFADMTFTEFHTKVSRRRRARRRMRYTGWLRDQFSLAVFFAVLCSTSR
jgi:hypothetical protein